jgi:chromosome segregation ATPase
VKPLRNGDLIPADDASELIDSAQAAATELAHSVAYYRERATEAEREARECRLALCTMDDHNAQLVETICGLRAEIERLRAAIREWNDSAYSHSTFPNDEEKQARRAQAVEALRKIAREGR